MNAIFSYLIFLVCGKWIDSLFSFRITMHKVEEKLFHLLMGMKENSKELENFLRLLTSHPYAALHDHGIDIPKGKMVGFVDEPAEQSEEIINLAKVGESKDENAMEELLRDFAKNVELIATVANEDSSMPEGATQLNENELKRIVG